MIYRKLDENGDYSFGNKLADFLVNSPDAVAQAVKTRLMLWQGEWFANINSGTPYDTRILGNNTLPLYDQAVREVIAGTQGVVSIVDYASYYDSNSRSVTIAAILDTVYGQAQLTVTQ